MGEPRTRPGCFRSTRGPGFPAFDGKSGSSHTLWGSCYSWTGTAAREPSSPYPAYFSSLLGFVSPEVLAERLQVRPGTATPLALFNDSDNAVTLVVDAALEGAEQLNFHPMTHTESIGLSWPQFLSFLHSCHHTPTIAELGEPTPETTS